MDKSWRIVFPRSIRERFGLAPDLELEVIEEADGILIRRREKVPSMVKIDGFWVHPGTPEPGA